MVHGEIIDSHDARFIYWHRILEISTFDRATSVPSLLLYKFSGIFIFPFSLFQFHSNILNMLHVYKVHLQNWHYSDQ